MVSVYPVQIPYIPLWYGKTVSMHIEKIIVTAGLLAAVVFPVTSFAFVPFGGRVVSPAPQPCLNIPGAFAVEMVGFLGSTFGPFSAITQPGFTRSFLFGPLTAPGQWGLGSGIPDVTCITGIKTSIVGIKIDALPGHGSSLPGF